VRGVEVKLFSISITVSVSVPMIERPPKARSAVLTSKTIGDQPGAHEAIQAVIVFPSADVAEKILVDQTAQ
jgi:hypothetical protein